MKRQTENEVELRKRKGSRELKKEDRRKGRERRQTRETGKEEKVRM